MVFVLIALTLMAASVAAMMGIRMIVEGIKERPMEGLFAPMYIGLVQISIAAALALMGLLLIQL